MLAPTLDDIVRPYLHLPSAVQTALIRVETHPTFRILTKGALKTMKALMTRASATNGTTIIRARVDRLAVEAGVSEKTVQRALSAFKEFGWVRQASEGRSEWGVYESRRYVLSPALCELVLLPTKEKSAEVLAQEREKARETEMSAGAIRDDLSLEKDLQGISIKNREGKPPVLPPAVSHVPAETGILATGVCKLLGIARTVGYQLEHVYEAAKPYLTKLGNASPARTYRYLLAMLLNPKKVDYAGKAAQALRNAQPDGPKSLAAIAKLVRYKHFYHVSNGMRVKFFDGQAEVRMGDQVDFYAGPQMQGLYRGVANGKLKEVIE